MRGERRIETMRIISRHGSSPHARGTQTAAAVGLAEWRFIPACAGNACLGGPEIEPGTVHPRMRGERHPFAYALSSRAGSSPHARGTHLEEGDVDAIRRFIPACAGNAPRRVFGMYRSAVHPRMRGERTEHIRERSAEFGSSPHARGTLPGGGHDQA